MVLGVPILKHFRVAIKYRNEIIMRTSTQCVSDSFHKGNDFVTSCLLLRTT